MKWGKHRRYGKRRRSRLFCILYILYPLLLCLCLGASCVFRLLSFHCSAYSVYFCTVPLAVSSLLGNSVSFCTVPLAVSSLLGNSIYFCTVPLAAFSLLGIQRLLLHRSAAASGGTQLRPHVLRSGQRKKARARRRALKTE